MIIEGHSTLTIHIVQQQMIKDILNGTLSGVPAQATLPVIDEDTKSYTIELTDLALDSSSVQQTFNLDHRCSVYEGFKLMYLNRGGSFSTFNFELADKKTIKVKKTNFKQNYGEYNVASNSYGWESSDRGETRLDTDINESYALTSNYMRESYGNLIEDLIISPEVYHLELVVSYTDPVATSNMTDTAGFLTLFTASTATLSVGDTVLLEGVSLPEYNGEHIITSIVDMATTSLPVSFGTWSLKSNEDRRLRAVDVDTSSVKIKRRLTDNLINYSVKIRYSNKNIVQR